MSELTQITKERIYQCKMSAINKWTMDERNILHLRGLQRKDAMSLEVMKRTTAERYALLR